MATMKAAVLYGLAIVVTANPALAQTRVNETKPAAHDGTVKIAMTVGSLRVVGWREGSVTVTGTLGAGTERLDFETGGRKTFIRVVLPREVSNVTGSHLEIHVPRGSTVAVRTAGADIEVKDVNGSLDLESVSGGIHVTGSARMVYAESATGDVELDVAAKVIRAKSIDGAVTVRGALGFVEVSTVSGSASLIGTRVWEGEVTSVSGPIHFEGDFQPEGSFYFESHSGTIDLVFSPHVSADFEVTAVGGATLENEFAPPNQRAFSIGGGRAQVKIKSFKGRVRIRNADSLRATGGRCAAARPALAGSRARGGGGGSAIQTHARGVAS